MGGIARGMEELGKSHRTLRAAWHWYRRYAHAVQSQRTWFLLLVDWLLAALASCTTAYACKSAVLDRCKRTLVAVRAARHACDPGQTRTHRVKARDVVFRLVGGLLFGCFEFSLFLLRNIALPNAPVRPPRAVWALRARDDLQQQQSAREQFHGRYSLIAVAEVVAALAAPAGAPLTSYLSSSGWGVRCGLAAMSKLTC